MVFRTLILAALLANAFPAHVHASRLQAESPNATCKANITIKAHGGFVAVFK